jgi:hypothetical protein
MTLFIDPGIGLVCLVDLLALVNSAIHSGAYFIGYKVIKT